MFSWLVSWWKYLVDRRPSKVISVELFEDASGYWRWRLRAANGQILAVSEAYSSESKAMQTAKLIRSSDYEIHVDQTKPTPKKGKPKFPL
jgi:hypothetical protein